jgi:diguanylate cyclase (GGDEF)-like protein
VALGVAFLLFAARTSAREWQLQSVHSELKRSVLRDPLTSVANRTLLDAEISQRLLRPSTASGMTAVLFVGLDRFKTLNDCLGHIFGDLLLQRVAGLLSASIRKQDLVARYGGDEFVILVSATSVKEAEAFAERILGLMRSPLHLEGRLLYLSVSIGCAMSKPGTNAATMLQEAHFAMHHAKKSGKDRVQVFEPEMLQGPQFRLGIETDLRRALAEDQISVHYQPIFAVETGEIEGFEALARWQHPERGFVSPADFIPVAEDTGMIIDLGNQILLKACRQCHEWNQRFGASWTMNVNVSAHQFASPKILEQIVHTLVATGLEARYLKLEITESVLISGYSHVEEVLAEARKLGMQICLDDFGTGYSSLSYLLNYPFDVVKIDQSFVRHLDEDPSRADVVRTLVSLARSLKKHTVAEGIERPEEMDCLREFGCELAQGYLLSRPLSAEAATTLLQAQRKITLVRSEGRYLGSEISAAS